MTRAVLEDKRVQQLVGELCATVRRHFPEAEFEVYEGNDPTGIYIYAYADIDDTVDMLQLVSERIADIVDEEGVIIAVIPLSKSRRRSA